MNKAFGTHAVKADVVCVIDGNTVNVDAYPWLDMTIRTRVRLARIDTPELKGKCKQETKPKNVRFTPESGHNQRQSEMSAFDPKRSSVGIVQPGNRRFDCREIPDEDPTPIRGALKKAPGPSG